MGNSTIFSSKEEEEEALLSLRPCSDSGLSRDYALDVFRGVGQLSTKWNHVLCEGAHQSESWKGREGIGKIWPIGKVLNSEENQWVTQSK